MNTFKIAEIWANLMQELGYAKFLAQGGDFGANVSTVLAWKHPKRLLGLHLNYIPGSYHPYVDVAESPITEEELQSQVEDARWFEEKGGYCTVQNTQPQTLAFALHDSPMGLAAWLIDKFRNWSDCDGDVERRFSKDDLLANVSLYWLTETTGSSMRLYFERRQAPLHFGKGRSQVPERRAVPGQKLGRTGLRYRPLDNHARRRPLRSLGGAGTAGPGYSGIRETFSGFLIVIILEHVVQKFRDFTKLLVSPTPLAGRRFECPKSRLTRVITGENRSGAGDLLPKPSPQSSVVSPQQKQPQKTFAVDER